MTTSKLNVGATKNQLFWHNYLFFFKFSSSNCRNSGICAFHKHSGLILCNFRNFLTWLKNREFQDGGSKMADQMTSLLSKMVWSCKASPGLSDPCKFISLCPYRKEKQEIGFHLPPPPTLSPMCHGRGMSYLVRPRVKLSKENRKLTSKIITAKSNSNRYSGSERHINKQKRRKKKNKSN